MKDHKVGYKNPPRHGRFKKGQSGNPNGRPKNNPQALGIVQKLLNQKIKVKQDGTWRTTTKFEALLSVHLNKALQGDDKAFKALRDLIGKQPHVAEEPITVVIRKFG